MQQQLSAIRQHQQQGLMHCSRLLTATLIARHSLHVFNAHSNTFRNSCTSMAVTPTISSSCSSWCSKIQAGSARNRTKRASAYASGGEAAPDSAHERRVRPKHGSTGNNHDPPQPAAISEVKSGNSTSAPLAEQTAPVGEMFRNARIRGRGRGRVQSSTRRPLAWRSSSSNSSSNNSSSSTTTTSSSSSSSGAPGQLKTSSGERSGGSGSHSSSSRKTSVRRQRTTKKAEQDAMHPLQDQQNHQRRSQQAQQRSIPNSMAASNSSSNSNRSASKSSNTWQQRQQQLHPSAAAALRNIKHKSFLELQQLVQQYGPTASLTDLMAMCSRLKLVPWDNIADKSAVLDQLWALLRPQLQKRASPRHCTEAMLAASRLQYAPAGLYTECLGAIVAMLHAAGREYPAGSLARILANSIYAVGTAPGEETRLQCRAAVEQQLLPMFQRCVHAASSQAVSNTVYAAALLELRSLDLKLLLSRVPKETLRAASTQELSNILWAAGTLGTPPTVQQLQQLLGLLTQKLGAADPQHITSTLWGVANLQMRMAEAQIQQLAAAVISKGGDARTASSTLHSVAKMGHQLPQQQVDQLLAVIAPADSTVDSSSINPQSISNALWAVAAMKRVVNPQQLRQLMQIHVQQLRHPDTSLQCMSNILWAISTLQVNVDTAALQEIFDKFTVRMLTTFATHGGIPEPQAVSNALWAAASMNPPFLPRQLLEEPAAVNFILEHLLPRMKLQEVSNVVSACALLGYDDLSIVQPLINKAADLVPGTSSSTSNSSRSVASTARSHATSSSSSSSNLASDSNSLQAWCNICWAAAVLDAQPVVPQLLAMAQDCARLWAAMGIEDKVQLWQLHMWMQDSGCWKEGLTQLLSEQQLQDCRAAWSWLVVTKTKVSYLQEQVFAAVQHVPILHNAVLEARTHDQLISADIMATGPEGQPLVLEVDGPYHYRRPDNAMTGTTRYRNRALAARGYTVVTIPWWEWQRVGNAGMPAKVQYLQGAVQHALTPPQQQWQCTLQQHALEEKPQQPHNI